METGLKLNVYVFFATVTASVFGCCSANNCPAPLRMQEVDNITLASEVLSYITVRTFENRMLAQCMFECPVAICLGMVYTFANKTCRVLVINTEGPHPHSVYKTVPGTKVWQTVRTIIPNAIFETTSTGKNGSLQTFTVTATGCYNITAYGAKGGSNLRYNFLGGKGAMKVAKFTLSYGTKLTVVAGQRGSDTLALGEHSSSGAGGGGGSFVYKTSGNVLLVAAAGGGGAQKVAGVDGQNENNGTASAPASGGESNVGSGGINGNPGSVGPDSTSGNDGGAGAGWLGSGPAKDDGVDAGCPGLSLSGGWLGGDVEGSNPAYGGFGGGGAGGFKPCENCPPGVTKRRGNGGGGGGYSGGGAGGIYNAGGGGGSYTAPEGVGATGTTGGNTEDHGRVLINYIGINC